MLWWQEQPVLSLSLEYANENGTKCLCDSVTKSHPCNQKIQIDNAQVAKEKNISHSFEQACVMWTLLSRSSLILMIPFCVYSRFRFCSNLFPPLEQHLLTCLQKWRAWLLERVQAKRTGRISSWSVPKLERSFWTVLVWSQRLPADLFARNGELRSIATKSFGQKSTRCSQKLLIF